MATKFPIHEYVQTDGGLTRDSLPMKLVGDLSKQLIPFRCAVTVGTNSSRNERAGTLLAVWSPVHKKNNLNICISIASHVYVKRVIIYCQFLKDCSWSYMPAYAFR